MCQNLNFFLSQTFKKISDEIFGGERKFLEELALKIKNSPIPFSWAIHEKELKIFLKQLFENSFAAKFHRKYRLQIERQRKVCVKNLKFLGKVSKKFLMKFFWRRKEVSRRARFKNKKIPQFLFS